MKTWKEKAEKEEWLKSKLCLKKLEAEMVDKIEIEAVVKKCKDWSGHFLGERYTELSVLYNKETGISKWLNEKALELPPYLNLKLKKGDKIKISIEKLEV